MDKIIIYTDGACSNNQSAVNFGGYGAVLISMFKYVQAVIIVYIYWKYMYNSNI